MVPIEDLIVSNARFGLSVADRSINPSVSKMKFAVYEDKKMEGGSAVTVVTRGGYNHRHAQLI